MNLVVTGGRNYVMTRADYQYLESVVRLTGARAILTDGTSGVAAQAEAWARRRGLTVQRYTADWLSERNASPTRRNDMLAQAGDAVVAFPGGNATADMVAKAWLKELPVHESPSWRGITAPPSAKPQCHHKSITPL
jgi:predicted Rossmann-fold nucleotide-binding protein